jgi:hypothetical protein
MIEKKPHGIIMFTTLFTLWPDPQKERVVHWHLSSRDHLTVISACSENQLLQMHLTLSFVIA